MATHGQSDEMTFEEFKELVGTLPPEFTGLAKEFREFLATGCSEAQAKRWLAAHIWDFPDDVRNAIVMAFMADALYKSATEDAPPMTDAERNRKFMDIWKSDGFYPAKEWMRRQREVDGRKRGAQ